MKIVHAGTISTTLVIVLGVLMIFPVYLRANENTENLTILLFFNVINENGAKEWCEDVSSLLKKYRITATVFFTGKIADLYPECVTFFEDNIDIGSQTYSYVDLKSIPNYALQLDEVRNGKLAIDYAGNLYSKVFRAPHGSVDDNIYSLLNRSNIVADFSYEEHYNKYQNGLFLNFNLQTYNSSRQSLESLLMLHGKEPVVVSFDNSTPVEQINEFLTRLKSHSVLFVNVSDVTGLNLTIRKGVKN